jgi:hypothetical protein
MIRPGHRDMISNLDTQDGAAGNVRRIIPFRRRGGANFPVPPIPDASTQEQGSPVSDLAKFEGPEHPGHYRHRMIVNVAALGFTVVLVVAGIWIAETMAVLRKNQDCVLMGRRGCSPVVQPANDRWTETSAPNDRKADARQP